jgi:hypothetical protein
VVKARSNSPIANNGAGTSEKSINPHAREYRHFDAIHRQSEYERCR